MKKIYSIIVGYDKRINYIGKRMTFPYKDYGLCFLPMLAMKTFGFGC